MGGPLTTIRITKLRFGALLLAVTLLVPSAAWATHVFIDVPDTSPFAADIEWASTNGITSGRDGVHFEPGINVTRQESVAFLKRYNDNVAAPATAANTAAIAALPSVMWARVAANGTVEASSGSVTVNHAGTGFFDVTFPQNVGNCAIQTALYMRSNGFALGLIGLAYLHEGFTYANDNDSVNDGTVRAFTATHDLTSASGNDFGVNIDLPFTITANC